LKNLLTMTALIEGGAGASLLCCPSAMVVLLLGSGLDTSTAMTLGRVAGAALFALGAACLFARDDGSLAARGLVRAMVLYNLAVAAILAVAGIGSGLIGIALWPAVVLHGAMAAWCVRCLLRTQAQINEKVK
jgi:hypothetical protein